VSKPIRLGYSFIPLPYRVQGERQAGRLSAQGQDLLRVLYRNASFRGLAARDESVRLTLPQLREQMPYTNTDDALARLIRRHRDDGWFTYRLQRRDRQETYFFTLLCDDQDDSSTTSTPLGEGLLWTSEESGQQEPAPLPKSSREAGNSPTAVGTHEPLDRTRPSTTPRQHSPDPATSTESRTDRIRTHDRPDTPPHPSRRSSIVSAGSGADVERTANHGTAIAPEAVQQELLDQLWAASRSC
jgi:hypothetical protein